MSVIARCAATPNTCDSVNELNAWMSVAAAAAIASGIPYLPGIATAGEIMGGLDIGLSHFKFFPAGAAGGLAALKALAAPFGGVRFCPTGGISEESAPSWLDHPSVLCVGGSWIVPADETDLSAIAARARAAAALHA